MLWWLPAFLILIRITAVVAALAFGAFGMLDVSVSTAIATSGVLTVGVVFSLVAWRFELTLGVVTEMRSRIPYSLRAST